MQQLIFKVQFRGTDQNLDHSQEQHLGQANIILSLQQIMSPPPISNQPMYHSMQPVLPQDTHISPHDHPVPICSY